MIHSVKNLLDKIDKNTISETNKSLKTCLYNFRSDLQLLVEKHTTPTDFDQKYIFTNFTETDNIELFCKANLIASKLTLDRLIKKISKFNGGVSFHNIKKFEDFIKILISDLKGIVEKFEKRINKNYEFVPDSYSSLIEANILNMMSNNFLFTYYLKEDKLNSLHHLGLAVLNLRQSIEVRTKRALGIWKVEKKDKKCNDLSYAKLIEFIECNTDLIEYDKLSFNTLKNIYNWSSDYVHNAILPLIWQIEYALLVIKEYYSPGSYSNDNLYKWSVNGRIKIRDYDEIKSRISRQYEKCYKFNFLNEPDALLID